MLRPSRSRRVAREIAGKVVEQGLLDIGRHAAANLLFGKVHGQLGCEVPQFDAGLFADGDDLHGGVPFDAAHLLSLIHI